MINERVGILLVNLGTPDAPTTRALRPYLREFLSDPRVLDIPSVPRFLLVNALIVPFRSPKSAAAYRTVWGDEGSPLLRYAKGLAAGLGEGLAPHPIAVAMRYGRPAISDALEALQGEGVDRIVVFPLFPQYASAAWGSAVQAVYAAAGALPYVPSLSIVPPYYDDPVWAEAVAAVSRPVLDAFRPDHVLMSYHGIPERQCTATDFGDHCFRTPDCCARLTEVNRACYRAQCFAGSRVLTERLALDPSAVTTAFQSRLGRIPWIRPYTDEVVPELARQGVRRLAVLCPSFVADCLETLEEIGDRAAEDFRAAGGEELRLVPCLNDAPEWVEAVATLVRRVL